MGREKTFANLTEHNIEAIKQTGAKTVVTACAGCYRTWKVDVAEAGYEHDFQVLHITEFLDITIHVILEGTQEFMKHLDVS